MIIVMSSLAKSSAFKMFSVHTTKQIPPIRKAFSKAPFSVWISVDGRPKRKKYRSVFKFIQRIVKEALPVVTISQPVHEHAQVQLSWRTSRFLPLQIS